MGGGEVRLDFIDLIPPTHKIPQNRPTNYSLRRPYVETDLTTVLFLNYIICTVPANNFIAIIK